MLISRHRRFIFVHIPKTAGTSICEALAAMNDTTIGCKVQHPLGRRIRQEIDKQIWDELYKFAFVRNPWGRLVSWYNALQEHPPLPRHQRVRDELSDFSTFLKYGINYGLPIWRNQLDWIAADGDVMLVNFVGRFETLQDDFMRICEYLAMPAPRLPHLNATTPVDYRDFYSPALRKLVRDKYQRDIATFNYRF